MLLRPIAGKPQKAKGVHVCTSVHENPCTLFLAENKGCARVLVIHSAVSHSHGGVHVCTYYVGGFPVHTGKARQSTTAGN